MCTVRKLADNYEGIYLRVKQVWNHIPVIVVFSYYVISHSRRNSVDELERPRTPCTPPAARTPPPANTPPPEGTLHRRGDFTRQEYERRHQLKIMEDLDKVLRQKPTTVRGVKKQRPKTVFRDDSGLSRSPAKGLLGTCHCPKTVFLLIQICEVADLFMNTFL